MIALGLLGVGVGMAALAMAQGLPAQAQMTGGAQRCAALASVRSPGLEVTSAKMVATIPAGTVQRNPFGPEKIGVPLPEHCRVEGTINRRKGVDGVEYGIGFALALPTDWNGRFLYQGGGGLNGSIGEPYGIEGAGDVPALARGFAVVATDSGHKGAVFDDSFMRDQQAALDFAYHSVGRTTETGRHLATIFYGREPSKTYSAGCSTGGREGMLAAQSYPLMFDGVVAAAPAMRTGHSNIALANAAAAFNRVAPKDAEGRPIPTQAFSSADRKLLAGAVAGQCDALDGLEDDLLFNLGACRFDPGVLQCKGAKTDSCLSAGQVDALRTAFGGPKDSRGQPIYSAYPYDLGLLVERPGISFFPTSMPSPLGPPNLALTLDVEAERARVLADDLQSMTDTAFWTNLSTFYGRGGKIIFYHGASDPWFSTYDTEDYERRLRAANPGFDSSRFYNVPSMSHCGGGGLDRFDMLGPLVDWVENGRAPGAIVAKGVAFPGRTRPLCPAPQHAHYKGNGDPNDAGNFECRGN
jgi:feruloyl esterase